MLIGNRTSFLPLIQIVICTIFLFILFFKCTAPPEIYTLSLHDALPISRSIMCSHSEHIDPSPTCHRDPPTATGVRYSLTRSEEHSLNSSHMSISYAVFCLKKKTQWKRLHFNANDVSLTDANAFHRTRNF